MATNRGGMEGFSPKRMALGLFSSLGLSFIVIYILLHRYRLEQDLGDILASLPAPFILAALLLLLIGWVADALRIRELAGIFGIPLPLRLAFPAVLAGNFAINITPFYMGAGLVHIYVFREKGLDLPRSTAAVAGGALVSHASQAILALVSLVLTWEAVALSLTASRALVIGLSTYLAFIVALGIVAGLVEDPSRLLGGLLRYPQARWAGDRLRDFHRGLALLLKAGPRRLGRMFLFSLVYLVSFYSITPVLLAGMGFSQPLGQVIAFQLVLFFAASLAPTPGSAGAIELGAFSLFSFIVPLDILGNFLVWWRLLTFYLNVLVGTGPFIYLAIGRTWS
ncbi:MAG: lysylphosphatidylglycerol synthase transmembrane domain-containing protein [Bacillota bacterium]